MDKLTICPMEKELTPSIAAIEKECFNDPWSHAMFLSEGENPLAVYFAALTGGEVCGYIGMHNILGEGYITNVAVRKSSRRAGVASALISEIIRYSREHSLSFITLEVRASNSGAIALYRGFGFEQAGLRRGYYSKPAEDAVIMTLFLR